MAFHPLTAPEVRAALGFTASDVTALKALAEAGGSPSYTVAAGSSTGTVGTAIPITATPVGGGWPAGETLSAALGGIQGTFSPQSATPTAGSTGAVTFALTPTSAGTGLVTVSASPSLGTPAGVQITVVAAQSTPTPAPTLAAATAFTTALSVSSGTVGNAVTLTVMPTSAAWPSSVVLTPAETGLSGTFAPNTYTPSGTAAATFAFTPSAAGSGTISVSASPSMTGPAGLAYQATAAATPTPTPAPAPTSDGTLTGLPSTIVAGQPLSAVTYTPGQATPPYFVLFNVTAGAEEGLRWPNGVMRSKLELLIPQAAATYTVRGYAAASGGSPIYESAQIAVTAAPGALPATPAQAADSGATSNGVTMNWSATAASYHVLARPGVGAAYGSRADATVTTNSYTLTGLAASSSPRAVVIPQNANGYGTPTGQFLSFTTA